MLLVKGFSKPSPLLPAAKDPVAATVDGGLMFVHCALLFTCMYA